MSHPDHFVSPRSGEILKVLGATVTYVLSDMPWSFGVQAGGGETVKVWVSELPDTRS